MRNNELLSYRMLNKIFLVAIILIIFSASILLYMHNHWLENRIKKGNKVKEKVEVYKIKNGRLPNSLTDIGEIDSEEGPIYYDKVDSITYMISFGLSLGESETYSSKTKKWENYIQ